MNPENEFPENVVFREVLAQNNTWKEDDQVRQNLNRRARNLRTSLGLNRNTRNNMSVNSNNSNVNSNNNNNTSSINNRSTILNNAEEIGNSNYTSNGGRRKRSKKTRKGKRGGGRKSRRMFCRK
jgi:hypothetical protein